MHPVVYVMLVAGSAHVQRTYGSSADDFHQGLDTVQGERMWTDDDDLIEAVLCPVCDNEFTRSVINYECLISVENAKYKQCKYGVYKNPACGGRLDCFRQSGETCTSGRLMDHYGWYCAPGLTCNSSAGLCEGTEVRPIRVIPTYVSPERYPTPSGPVPLPYDQQPDDYKHFVRWYQKTYGKTP